MSRPVRAAEAVPHCPVCFTEATTHTPAHLTDAHPLMQTIPLPGRAIKGFRMCPGGNRPALWILPAEAGAV